MATSRENKPMSGHINTYYDSPKSTISTARDITEKTPYKTLSIFRIWHDFRTFIFLCKSTMLPSHIQGQMQSTQGYYEIRKQTFKYLDGAKSDKTFKHFYGAEASEIFHINWCYDS